MCSGIQPQVLQKGVNQPQLLVSLVHVTERLHKVSQVEANVVNDADCVCLLPALYSFGVFFDKLSKIFILKDLCMVNM